MGNAVVDSEDQSLVVLLFAPIRHFSFNFITFTMLPLNIKRFDRLASAPNSRCTMYSHLALSILDWSTKVVTEYYWIKISREDSCKGN